ncbi:heat-shock protein HtpX [Pengzhenrongella frigida]|uniref:Heat-shock protein HtpX n=1 Tax=Pengzhenrongella frigida TaxID=1259133 RepID=A0A4Q5MXT9_9MICO|nr:heat-shock protein HtpX [Cellulomonas sp. HLT2-17]RYV49763.1 heat-shock protein HtpX [Cellulomonas sp. HLT2-17]
MRRPIVTFVCIHNAGRSQMAAGFARALGGDRVEVRSAGTDPDAKISATAAAAMAEVGIDITAQVPRLLTLADAEASDVVITTGCGADCAMFPGIDSTDWTLPTQAGPGIEHVRPVRDAIHHQVTLLLARLDR